MNRRIIILVALGVLAYSLTGVVGLFDRPPRFDTSSSGAFNVSLEMIKQGMSPSELRQLSIAIFAVAFPREVIAVTADGKVGIGRDPEPPHIAFKAIDGMTAAQVIERAAPLIQQKLQAAQDAGLPTPQFAH